MKRFALYFASVLVLLTCNNSANASDFSKLLRKAFGIEHHPHHHAAHYGHAQHHAVPAHRELGPHAGHQHALSRSQHARLHDRIDHAAFRDTLEHRSAYGRRITSPYDNCNDSYRILPYGYGRQLDSFQYPRPRSEYRIGRSPYDWY